jgi:hypothetical protein
MAACDIQCQRDRQLKQLSSAMVTAIQNKEKDPEAYERARTAYYTVKEGQGWLSKDNEEKANQQVQPILDSYQSKFDKMKEDMIYQTVAAQAKQDVMNSHVGDEEDVRFIHSQIEKEREEASVYQRTKELERLPVDVYSWLPSFLDLLLGISILYLVYQVFVEGKLSAVMNYFSQSPG